MKVPCIGQNHIFQVEICGKFAYTRNIAQVQSVTSVSKVTLMSINCGGEGGLLKFLTCTRSHTTYASCPSPYTYKKNPMMFV
jgi:hypothetical protein